LGHIQKYGMFKKINGILFYNWISNGNTDINKYFHTQYWMKCSKSKRAITPFKNGFNKNVTTKCNSNLNKKWNVIHCD
jgi:hypothetical protein